MDRVGKVGRAYEVPVTFDNVRDKNLMQLKKLNTAIFPVKYKDRYYSDALASGDFTKLGTFPYMPLYCSSGQREEFNAIMLLVLLCLLIMHSSVWVSSLRGFLKSSPMWVVMRFDRHCS
eukprot:c19304_g1_i1 orf=110-466(-)